MRPFLVFWPEKVPSMRGTSDTSNKHVSSFQVFPVVRLQCTTVCRVVCVIDWDTPVQNRFPRGNACKSTRSGCVCADEWIFFRRNPSRNWPRWPRCSAHFKLLNKRAVSNLAIHPAPPPVPAYGGECFVCVVFLSQEDVLLHQDGGEDMTCAFHAPAAYE